MFNLKTYIRRFTSDRGRLIDGLLEVADVVASPTAYDAKLEHLCLAATTMLRCDRSSVFLEKGGRFWGRFNVGNPADIAEGFLQHSIPLHDPLIAKALETRSFVVANKMGPKSLMSEKIAHIARIQSIVIAPLFDHHGTPLGIITAEFNEHFGQFSQIQSKVLLGLAKLAETVLHAQQVSDERAEIARQLEISSRLDALARLAAGVVHDLNNRLTVIVGAAEMISIDNANANGKATKSADDNATLIMQAANASAELTRQLLTFSRSLPGKPVIQNASKAVADLAYIIRRLVAGRCDYQPNVEADLYTRCSTGKIEQIVTNLVANACDASPMGSQITLRLSGTTGIDEVEYVRLEVIDQGSGILPEDLAHIFEPFFTTKGTDEGYGLGLAGVYGIVNAAGGSIDVQSSPGEGTTFVVLLPRVAEPATTTAPVEGSQPALAVNRVERIQE